MRGEVFREEYIFQRRNNIEISATAEIKAIAETNSFDFCRK